MQPAVDHVGLCKLASALMAYLLELASSLLGASETAKRYMQNGPRASGTDNHPCCLGIIVNPQPDASGHSRFEGYDSCGTIEG
jgi:hypothetical protein